MGATADDFGLPIALKTQAPGGSSMPGDREGWGCTVVVTHPWESISRWCTTTLLLPSAGHQCPASLPHYGQCCGAGTHSQDCYLWSRAEN